MEIKLNKTYDYFDDGKINPSRRLTAKIIEIIPFDEINSKTLDLWKEEVEACDWIYNKETDYFVKGHLEEIDVTVFFVRTIEGHWIDWFSLGWWSGVLDVDGRLGKELDSKIKKYD